LDLRFLVLKKRLSLVLKKKIGSCIEKKRLEQKRVKLSGEIRVVSYDFVEPVKEE